LPNFGFNFEENFKAVDFNFDSHLEKLKLQSDLLNATNPDLKNFFESNGKLLMWAGLADPLVLPQQTVDYYKNVRKLFGNNTDKFFKLFLGSWNGSLLGDGIKNSRSNEHANCN
jgi:hypothetical protein